MFFKKKSKRGLKGGAQRTYADGADYANTQGRYLDADFDEDDFFDDEEFYSDENFGGGFSEVGAGFRKNRNGTSRGVDETGSASDTTSSSSNLSGKSFAASGNYEGSVQADAGFYGAEFIGSGNLKNAELYAKENHFPNDADFVAQSVDYSSQGTGFVAQDINSATQGFSFAPQNAAPAAKKALKKRKNLKERLNFINPFSPLKQIFAALALIVCVVFAGIFVGDVLFGKRSFEVLRQLQKEKAFLFTDVERLKEENAELQKLYLERRSLDPDLKK
ncbi:hypothetical protein [uncultured Campylobacter sp.]|uniref:FtsB family cell division protein n=1 Tax=uncultured Campylobacter sp. TaxID=218934 RepID=UPI002612CAD1|nr:hypothetical protein [uncultured Campylobacter sp.]